MGTTHGHHGGIEFVIRFHEARKGHAFTVAKEVLRQAAARAGGGVHGAQVVELQILGIERLPRLVGHALLGAHVGGGGDDVVAPSAVGRGAVEGVSARLFHLARLRVEGVGEGRSLSAVVVLEVEQVGILIEDEVRAALRLQSVAHGGEGAFVQRLARGQVHGGGAASARLCRHDVTADGFARLRCVRRVRQEVTALVARGKEAGRGKGCSPCVDVKIVLHTIVY